MFKFKLGSHIFNQLLRRGKCQGLIVVTVVDSHTLLVTATGDSAKQLVVAL